MGQWKKRGRIHLLADRIVRVGDKNQSFPDYSVFASGEMLKLEDAKARILVFFRDEDIENFNKHPYALIKKIYDIPFEKIAGIAPVLSRYKDNLTDYGLPIENWSADEDWDQWLILQDSYEKIFAIKKLFRHLGIEKNLFQIDMNLLQILVQVSQRPQIIQKTNINELDDWIQLIQCRDKVLHQLRTEGHCGRTSFIRNSIELVLKEILFRDISIDELIYKNLDRGMNVSDLSDRDILYLCHKSNELNFHSPLFLLQTIFSKDSSD
jgi:hypothetical protein